MVQRERLIAALTYIFVLGWVVAIAIERKSLLVQYHLKQSLVSALYAVGVFIAWAIFAWGISLAPFIGAIMAVVAFTLVIATVLSLVPICLAGMINALRGRMAPVPIAGEWAKRL